MLALGRALGHARFIPFGIRDRVLRLLFPPQARRDFPYVTKVGNALYAGNLDNYIDWTIYFFGQYERAILSFMAATLPRLAPRPVFWDIGANSGQHSLFAAGLGAHVEAFEPYEPSRLQLIANLALNPGFSITVHPFGLANIDAHSSYTPPQDENQATGHFAAGGMIQLPLRRGDSVAARPPDMMKIDVEGYEGEVLKGLSSTIARSRPLLLCEFSERTKEMEPDLQFLVPDRYSAFTLTGAERPCWSPYQANGRGEMHLFAPNERAPPSIMLAQ